jgi:hypothetical protein
MDHNFKRRMQLAREVGFMRSCIEMAIADLEHGRAPDLIAATLRQDLITAKQVEAAPDEASIGNHD